MKKPQIKLDPSNARFPVGKTENGIPLCRCCGKPVYHGDGNPIHTKCIPNHWGKHVYGQNNSRCVEFKGRGPRRPTRTR